jgi:hypothetical protein
MGCLRTSLWATLTTFWVTLQYITAAAICFIPPPARVKDKHANNNRKRKEGKTTRNSTGRTHTATYVRASSNTNFKKRARQVCSKCVRAGVAVTVCTFYYEIRKCGTWYAHTLYQHNL